jgi:chromosome segregation ATPase
MADMASIKLFHSMLAPIMDAIPQVIEMLEKKADMDRTMAAYQADIEKTKAEVQAAYDEADTRIAQSNKVLLGLADKQKALQAALESTQVKLKADTEAAEDIVNSAKYAADSAVIEHHARAVDAAAKANAHIAVANQQYTERAAEITQAIAELEKRAAAANKTLDALRTKLMG